jgi:hypothetical protein
MAAIVTDVEDLIITVADTPAMEELPDRIRTAGWVSPTEAGLACSLITSGQPADLERARRILGGTQMTNVRGE